MAEFDSNTQPKIAERKSRSGRMNKFANAGKLHSTWPSGRLVNDLKKLPDELEEKKERVRLARKELRVC